MSRDLETVCSNMSLLLYQHSSLPDIDSVRSLNITFHTLIILHITHFWHTYIVGI